MTSWVAGRWIPAAFAAALLPCMCGQALVVRSDGGNLRIAAPALHFLAGRPLERLQNGAPVVFAMQLTLLGGTRDTVAHRTGGRFAVSYDLWEEKFAVTRLGNPRRFISHLAAAAAELWCLESLTIPTSTVSARSSFWVRLEVRAEDQEARASPEEEGGFNLARLVDFFSRAPRADQPRWQAEAGPLRLADLR